MPAWSTEVVPDNASEAGQRYRKEGLLGVGGMGQVHLAVDENLQREVALKQNAAGPQGRARLMQEALITARLEHPAIVPVYDAGKSADGQPWYTMRVVRGRTLAEAARAPDAPAVHTLLRHFLAATEAIAYAHHQGIIHRDIKPDNIMVGEFGETMVVDWGLARCLDDAQRPVPELKTRVGSIIGTPAYMSPEQALGQPLDRRSDVWSLGACLFALLTGSAPFSGSSDEIGRKVVSGTLPELDRPDLAPALAAIIRRCMRPAPGERYLDASALSAELSRYIDGHRVDAHDYTAAELASRAYSAWRVPIWVAAAFVWMLAGVGMWFTAQLATERDRALVAEEEALASQQAANQHLQAALSGQVLHALRTEYRAEAETLAVEMLRLGPSAGARWVLSAFDVTAPPELVQSEPLPPCDTSAISPSGAHLGCLHDGILALYAADDPRAPVWQREVPEGRVTFSNDDYIVAHGPHNDFTQLRVTDGAVVRHLVGFPAPVVVQWQGDDLYIPAAGLFFGNGRDRLTAYNERDVKTSAACADGTVYAVDVEGHLYRVEGETFVLLHTLELSGDNEAWRSRCTDGAYAMNGLRGGAAVLDRASGEVVFSHTTRLGTTTDVHVSRDGRRVAVVGRTGAVEVFDIAAGALLARLPRASTRAARLSADGQTVTTYGTHRQVWRLPEGSRPSVFVADQGIAGMDVRDDGRALAVSTGGSAVETFDLEGGGRLDRTLLGGGVAKAVAYQPGGNDVVVVKAVAPGVVRVAPGSGQPPEPLMDDIARRVIWTPDDLILISNWGLGPATHSMSAAPAPHLQQPGPVFFDLDAAPDRVGAVFTDDQAQIWRYDPHADPMLSRFPADQPGSFASLASDGRVAVASDRTVHILDGHTAQPTVPAMDLPTVPIDVEFSPDGRWLAVALLNDTAQVWDAHSGELVAILRGHDQRVSALRFSPDGTTLYTGSWDATVRAWSTRMWGVEVAELAAQVQARWGLSLDAAIASMDRVR